MYAKKPYSNFRQAMQAGSRSVTKAGALTLLHGSCHYLFNQALRRFSDLARSAGSDVVHINFQPSRHQHITNLFEAPSLFVSQTLYVVHVGDKSKMLTQLLKLLIIDQLPPNQMIIASHIDRLPTLTRFKLAPHLQTIPCLQPAPFEMPTFLNDIVRRQNISLSAQAAECLHELVGSDCAKLADIVDKLALVWPQADQPIPAKIVVDSIGSIREEHSFAIESYLLERKFDGAYALVINLLDRGLQAIAILGVISSFYRKALKIKELSARGLSNQGILAEIKMPTHILQKYQRFTQRSRLITLQRQLRFCQEADIRLKSTHDNSRLLLTQLIDLAKGG